MQRFWIALVIVIGLAFPQVVAADDNTVKVYLLAGQSNMEGKAQNKLWNHQATAPETKEMFAHLREGDDWVVRDDVFIKYLQRSGPLTLGFGSRDRTGAEYEFGYIMGEHHEQPVLLIKAAWGGHSLYKLFRSPSNPPPQELLEKDLKQKQEQTRNRNEKNNKNDPIPTMGDVKAEYGRSYRNMMQEVKDTQDNLDSLFPQLKGKQLEMAGFFWFQGWNDQYNGAETEYETNLKCLINDVRKDLNAPDLPVVIAVMGQNQSKAAKGAMKVIQDAQLAMEQVPEFKGNVKAVRTDVLVDKAAEALYPNWKDNVQQWEKTGSDHAYHYLGSAIWFTRIGRECAQAMIELGK